MNRLLGPCILLFSLALALGAAEIWVRMVFTGPARVTRDSERPARYFMPADAVTMQGRSVSIEKPQGAFRVAVIGDSFTFAPDMQYDDAFPARLERLLNLNRPESPHAQVLNLGVPGSSSANYTQNMRAALQYRPDVVLLQVTLNDAQLRPLSREPPEVRRSFGPFDAEAVLGPLRHWKTLSLVAERLHNSASVRDYVRYHHDLYSNPASWDRFAQAIVQTHELATQARVAFGVVLFPLFDFPIDDHYPFMPIHDKISTLLKSRKIPYLDLFQAYRGIQPIRLQLTPGRDTHPNEIAHRIAAEKILAWGVRQNLIARVFAPRRAYPHRDNVIERSTRKVSRSAPQKKRKHRHGRST